MRFLSIFLVLGLLFPLVKAQTLDEVQKLDEVIIVSPRFKHFNNGHFYSVIDSATKTTQAGFNLGDVLTNASILQVNNYGVGSSSVSARGMGEKRTPVIWNGFNIQSIVSTSCDLSQLPNFFFDDVRVQMGGSSALFGSGSAGGMVFLGNKQKMNPGIKGQFVSNVGSFNHYYDGGSVSVANENFSVAIKGYYTESANNFPYKADYNGKMVDTTQTNAKTDQYGFMMNNFMQINPNLSVNANFWYTKSNKNIAPTLSETASQALADGKQADEFYAITAEMNSLLGIANIALRSGYFFTKLDYEKPSWFQISNSKAKWNVNEIEATISFFNFFKINSGFNFTFETAESSSFIDIKERYRQAVFSSFKFFHPEAHVSLSVNGRQELVAGKTVPFTYSIGADYTLFEMLVFKGNLAKNYRLPSLNDLYYKDSWSEGNPDLKPESGMNYEMGVEFKTNNNPVQYGFGANFFLSMMDNWINWAEREDYIWGVFNIDKAKIKGEEFYLQFGLQSDMFGLNTRVMYAHTNATDRNTKKTIPNVPQHKFTLNLQPRINNTSLLFQMVNVGERFSNASNKQRIEPYSITNITLTQTFKFTERYVSLDFGINNLFDTDYMVLNSYPMPKRSFRGGLRVQF